MYVSMCCYPVCVRPNLFSVLVKYLYVCMCVCVVTLCVSALTYPLHVVVQDEGPGISLEDQRKLFNNFVQIRPGKLQKGGGSGLGLTIAKQIVELHGGRIGVSSTEGYGSQFFFAIPFQVTYALLATSVSGYGNEVNCVSNYVEISTF